MIAVVKMEFAVHCSMPKTESLDQKLSLLSIESERVILKSRHTVALHQYEFHCWLLNTQTVSTKSALSSIQD